VQLALTSDGKYVLRRAAQQSAVHMPASLGSLFLRAHQHTCWEEEWKQDRLGSGSITEDHNLSGFCCSLTQLPRLVTNAILFISFPNVQELQK